MNLVKNVLIKRKNNCMILPWTSLFQFFKVILFVWNKSKLISIMSFSLFVHMSANYSFTENIVITKMELCYFVLLCQFSLEERKVLMTFFHCSFSFYSVRSVCVLSIYDWHVCPWGFKTRYWKQFLYLSVLIVFVSKVVGFFMY